jgi:hypothetical protein
MGIDGKGGPTAELGRFRRDSPILYNVGLVRAEGLAETFYLYNDLGIQLLTLLNVE